MPPGPLWRLCPEPHRGANTPPASTAQGLLSLGTPTLDSLPAPHARDPPSGPAPRTPSPHSLSSLRFPLGHLLTVVQLAGLGGMGELEVVEVGVLLDWLKISSSM